MTPNELYALFGRFQQEQQPPTGLNAEQMQAVEVFVYWLKRQPEFNQTPDNER